jgi:hypothetical protein
MALLCAFAGGYMRLSRVGEIQDKFWQRVDKRGPDDCWNWTGTLNMANGGYGVIGGLLFGLRYVRVGTPMLAHRVSWIMHFGEPTLETNDYHGWVILHKCDNPRCVNPGHLRLGSQLDNIKDMQDKGRGSIVGLAPRKGHASPRSKLSAEQVQYILSSTKTNGELATELGVSKGPIKRLRCGKSGYVDEQTKTALQAAAKLRKGLSRPGMLNPFCKISDEQVQYIRSSPLTTYQLAAELGIHQTTAARIRRGATHK